MSDVGYIHRHLFLQHSTNTKLKGQLG